MENIKSRISNLQFKMNNFEEQLIIAEDAKFVRNLDKREDLRKWYNQYIQEFYSEKLNAFQHEIIEIKEKINLFSCEEKSTLIYDTEIENLSKMNENFKKRVDALIMKLND